MSDKKAKVISKPPRKAPPKKRPAKAVKASTAKASKAKVPPKAPAQAHSRKFEPDDLDGYIERLLSAKTLGAEDTHWSFDLLKRYFDPQVLGLDNLNTQRPTVYVANHCMWGIDGGMAPSCILQSTGRLPRLLTDSSTMMGPMEDMLIQMGQVLANPRVCNALMETGQDIMVFPGGAREGTKKKGQAYQLMWEGRTGFVRMAMQHGYTITPFCTVGPDDMWDVVVDRDDVLGTPVARLLERLFPELWDAEHFPPIPRGLGPTFIPRPERWYLNFGKPLDTAPYKGREDDKALLTQLKDVLQQDVENLIKDALLVRLRQRKNMGFLRRMLTRN